ncbi:striatin isoform X1 [Tetranychus urticae]|uniref:Striatin N-terminal domain-containing protein n=2 Tax=Tetranychus urticae TaxID=32264 RepID=T1L2V4_TETUR|nr:striatin isoform X1 [Tetranychus urticae]
MSSGSLMLESKANSGDSSNINNNNSNNNVNNSGNNQTNPGQPQPQTYTIPCILHYLQSEWQRFELERQQWHIERTELKATISLLQGERKGQENLKADLVRRIKMLEYCLRQERAKYHKLKYGVDAPTLDNFSDESKGTGNNDTADGDTSGGGGANCDSVLEADADGVNWKHGRQLLRQYLQEIGYTDSIIDVRSSRVRSLLGLNNNSCQEDGGGKGKQVMGVDIRRLEQQQSPAMAVVSDAEASVLATFEFLDNQSRKHSNRNYDQMNEDSEDAEEDEDDGIEPENRTHNMDLETEEVLAEFDFLGNGSQKEGDMNCWRSGASKDVVELGDLAALSEESLDVNGTSVGTDGLQNSLNSEFRKTWNPRYILKSHFDCVRCLRFHSSEPLLVTCSEDETLKLWNLNKTQPPSNKGKQQATQGYTTFDLDPVYTYRGHDSKVLSLTLIKNTIYSGSQNGELFIWTIPSNIANIDPYDSFDPSLYQGSLEGHHDAIWSLCSLPTSSESDSLLCSASADSTIKIWNISTNQCVKTFTWQEADLRPTSLASMLPHSCSSTSSYSLLVSSFTDGSIHIYDVESSTFNQPLVTLKSADLARANSIDVHPTMPVVVSAHENHKIKFWDLNSGECIHEMVAHLDEVTSVACDPNGLHLLSGSHDCSVRLWNFDSRTCVQEITSHRKKFDEAIFDVTFHPSKPFFASAGADALAKVFI